MQEARLLTIHAFINHAASHPLIIHCERVICSSLPFHNLYVRCSIMQAFSLQIHGGYDQGLGLTDVQELPLEHDSGECQQDLGIEHKGVLAIAVKVCIILCAPLPRLK